MKTLKFLEQFLNRPDIDSGELGLHYDWEGNRKRKGKQGHSYPLLGTYAHPDSAVLRPFRCAFEFDREHHPQGVFFKQALLKTAVHVLSGAYDAAILVFLLKDGSSPETYHNDGSQYTQQLRRRFEEQGIYACMV